MLLVAIDTSGRKGSVAFCRGDEHSFETLQLTALDGGTYSALLMPAISAMLSHQHVTPEQVDAFIVVSGPGSFTGLRVGISTVKGLCEVLQKPLIAVSMLEALASARGPAQGTVTVVLDAGRGELYVGECKIADSRATVVRQHIAKLGAFSAEMKSSGRKVLTSDSKVAEGLAAAGLEVQLVDALRADEIGRIGLRKRSAGDVADPETLDADYIRRSDAELFAPKL